MKTTSTSLCIALAVVLVAPLPALADRGEFHGGYAYRDYPPRAQYHAGPHGHYHGYGWVAPAVVLGGIAAAVAAATYYPPRPVYVAPPQPVYVAPPSTYWNYCRSAGQYYPNIGYCPEGWQLVPAR